MSFIPKVRASAFRWCLVLLLTLIGVSAMAGTVSGRAYQDTNANGIWDVGELPRSGVDIVATPINNPFAPSMYGARTNDEGFYRIENMEPGRYEVRANAFDTARITAPETNHYVYQIASNSNFTDGNFGFYDECVKWSAKVLCDPINGGYTITLTVTNTGPFPIGHIFFNTGYVGYFPFPNPILPGNSATINITLPAGTQPGKYCFEGTAHSPIIAENICCSFAFCINLPVCDCIQITEENIVQNANGSVTWNFCFQNLTGQVIKFLYVVPPAGVNVNPIVIPVNPPNGLAPNAIWCTSVNITGAPPGAPLNLTLMAINSQAQICCTYPWEIPIPSSCGPVIGDCCNPKPSYDDNFYNTFGNIAAVTCGTDQDTMPVLAVMDLQNYQCNPNPPVGSSWNPSKGYHGEVNSGTPRWTRGVMGSIFGLTMDKTGDIYVTASGVYSASGDKFLKSTIQGSQYYNLIYRVHNITGIVTVFATSQTIAHHNYATDQEVPGLGNITYDCDHDQFFTSNLEDGKIYRMVKNGTGTANVLQTIDPWAAPAVDPVGYPALGERIWGIQYADGRLYFSRWWEDSGAPSPNQSNEVWSVAIDGTGAMQLGTLKKEATLPPRAGSAVGANNGYSNPVSDISFSPNASRMMCAERGTYLFGSDMSNAPHDARAVEFRCDPVKGWVPQMQGNGKSIFEVGGFSVLPESGAGGTDYDFWDCGPQGSTPRVWFTSNYMGPYTGGGVTYGLLGTPPSGGSYVNGVMIDLDNDGSTDDKTWIGDVELSCPPAGGHVQGTLVAVNGVGSVSNANLTIEIRNTAGQVVRTLTGASRADGTFEIPLDPSVPSGTYQLSLKSPCMLRRTIGAVTFASEGASNVIFNLITGDINDDNIIDLNDYLLLAETFDLTVGQGGFNPSADLNLDGTIDLGDYLILVQAMDQIGDE